MRWKVAAAATIGAALTVTTATGLAQAPSLSLGAHAARTGWADVALHGPVGARVTLGERVGSAVSPLPAVTLDAAGDAATDRLIAWRCDRRSRTIVASLPDGQTAALTVTTPPCTDRLLMSVIPRRPRASRAVRVTVRDRWRVGDLSARVCFSAHDAAGGCVRLKLPSGATARTVTLHPIRPGRAYVSLRAAGTATPRVAVDVRPRARRLRVLAAGDSLMQILDGMLADQLPGATVHSDAHISTGITKPWMLNWPARARRLSARLHPDATIVFLGANDGFGLPRVGGSGPVPCCSGPWVTAYAARVESMMRSYLRAGAGRVYWLTLPAPRRAAFAKVFRGVNAGLRRAAHAFPGQVRLVDTGRVFTPGGRFRQTIRRNGRAIDARQADGVHLSPAGDAVAASLVIRAMRRDGLLD